VTVAELTGEIPIVRTGDIPVVESESVEQAETSEEGATNGTAAPVAEPEPSAVRAELMSPDPVVDDEADDEPGAVIADEPKAALDEPAVYKAADDDLPSYLRGQREHLFGGSEATGAITEVQTAEEHVDAAEPLTPMRKFARGAWVVLQSIIAVAFGAGLFLGFDQLWRWNNIVALVLSVLVIIGLVVAVRIMRKTEDIGSTLIAVAVGALVTLGPLALLQSN
jgi:hypothetical protein